MSTSGEVRPRWPTGSPSASTPTLTVYSAAARAAVRSSSGRGSTRARPCVDLGCGDGIMAGAADRPRAALHRASTRASRWSRPARRRHPGVEFVAGRMEDYEPREPVDATLCLRAFYYAGGPRRLLPQASRGYTKVKFVFDFRQAEHSADVGAGATCARRASRGSSCGRSSCRSGGRCRALALSAARRCSSTPGRSALCAHQALRPRVLQRRRLTCAGARAAAPAWRRSPGSTAPSRSASPRRSSCCACSDPAGRGPVHDRRRARRLPGAARLAHERRRARQVRLPLRGRRGVGAVPPADRRRLHRARSARRSLATPADRGDRAVRRLDLRARRRARDAAPDRRAPAAAPGARVDRRRDADPRRPLRPARHLARRSRWGCGSPGSWIGAQNGVTAAVVGVVVAQAADDGLDPRDLGFAALRTLPAAEPVPLGDDRGPIIRFVGQSAAYTGLISLRTVGRAARRSASSGSSPSRRACSARRRCPHDGPQRALSSPLRMILLSEQTRDWEHGRPEVVLARDPPLRRRARRARRRSRSIPAWVLDAVARPASCSAPHYLPAVPAARLILVAARDPARAQLDEDLPGHDRPAGAPAVGARRRDRGDAAADRRARQGVGRDRARARRCSSRPSRSRLRGA